MAVNNFSLEYARDENNAVIGQWYPVSGQPVFPFSFGSLLDEKLDEAYVTIVRDSTNIYTSNTLFRVGFYKHGSTDKKYKYFICASDNAFEMPIGSKKYTHKLYLIEVTKRMEGIMCQSITFTNNGGAIYKQGGYATAEFDMVVIFGLFSDAFEPNDYKGLTALSKYNSPVPISNDTKKTMTAEQVFLSAYNRVNNKSYASISELNESRAGYEHITILPWYNTSEANTQTVVYAPLNGNQTRFETVVGADYNYVVTDSGTALNQEKYEGSFVIQHRVILAIETTAGRAISELYATVVIGPIQNKQPLKPYTLADCVDRVLDLAEPLFLYRETPRYALDPAQREWLAGITAPPFTMTQCTLREQLRVIGGYIHAEPRLIFNEDARTDENGNQYEAKKFYVHFDKFNSGANSSLQSSTPYIGRTFGQDINQYCTKVETSASNLVNSLSFAKGVIAEPNQHQVKTLRTETVNVRIDETNGIIATTYPIYEIDKVEFMGFGTAGGLYYGITDITPYIFEKTEYDANLTSFGGGYPYSKSFALYYTLGQRNIGGLFFKPQTEGTAAIGSEYLTFYSIVNILSCTLTDNNGVLIPQSTLRDQITDDLGGYPAMCFRVTYVPVYSARFSCEKPYYDPDAHKTDYMQVYNQSENVIDSKYYGENIKGVAARLGNVEQERTYIMPSLDNLPIAGDSYKDETGNYIISAVNTEYKPFYIKSTVALSRGFNRLSQYVGVNSVKRVYEVSEREAYRRSVHIKEFVVLGYSDENAKGEFRIFRDIEAIKSIFEPSIKRDKITAVNACGFNAGTENIDWQKAIGSVVLPVISSAFGNSMLFSWSYKDNYSAGEQASYQESGSIKGYFQKDVPYGNFFGRLYWYYFYLFGNIEDDGNRASLLTRDSAFSLPQYGVITPFTTSNLIGTVDMLDNGRGYNHNAVPLLLRKDSREALDFSFSVEFVSKRKDIRIGSALAQCCCLVSGKENHSKNENGDTLYLEVALLDEPLSEFDNFVPKDVTTHNIVAGFAEDTKVTVTISDLGGHHWAVITPIQEITEKRTLEDGTVQEVTTITGGEVLVASTNEWKTADENGELADAVAFSLVPTKNLY